MATKKIDLGMQRITPTLAKRWIKDRQYIVDDVNRQRSKRLYHVAGLSFTMEKGTYDGLISDIIFCRCNSQYYLIDGQHTLDGIVESDIAQDIAVRTIYCNDMTEVGEHYSKVDTGIGRTHRDAIVAAGLHPEYGLSDQRVSLITSAMPILLRGFQKRAGTNKDTWIEKDRTIRKSMVQEWIQFAKPYYDYVKSQASFRKHFNKAPIIAVGLVTTRYQPDKAQTFWEKVAQGNALDAKDPAKVLREKILELHGARIRVKPEYSTRLVAAAWNAHYENRKIKKLQVNTVNGEYPPIKICGTPYNGRKIIKPNVDTLIG